MVEKHYINIPYLFFFYIYKNYLVNCIFYAFIGRMIPVYMSLIASLGIWLICTGTYRDGWLSYSLLIILVRLLLHVSCYWSSSYVFHSIRVFSIAAVMCIFLVLPMNYYGQEMRHKHIPYESLDVFTIESVKEGSKWYV